MTPDLTPSVSGVRLDFARRRGDPLADDAVARLAVALGAPENLLGEFRRVLQHIAPPEVLREWFLAEVELPTWAEADLIRQGQEVFERWSLHIAASLACASLPHAYAAADGVQVLARTSALAGTQVPRRLAETAQLLFDLHGLTDRDRVSFMTGAESYSSVRMIRLLHAVIRHQVLAAGGWNAQWGVPVNQEDLLGTLLSFTTVVFDALDRLGVRLTPDEQKAYLHLWSIIGSLLGVDDAQLIADPATARAAHELIAMRHHKPSAEGRRLAAALLDELEAAMPIGCRKLPRTIIHHAAGRDVAHILDIPRPAWWGGVVPVISKFGRRATSERAVRAVAGWPMRVLGRYMIRMFIDRGLGGGPHPFRLTEAQAARWRLHPRTRRRLRRSPIRGRSPMRGRWR